MTHQRLTDPKKLFQENCLHGINLNEDCLRCVEFLIIEKQAEINIHRQEIISILARKRSRMLE